MVRHAVYVAAMGGLLLVAKPAQAQFANSSAGFSLGFSSLNVPGVDWGLPIGISYSHYLESNIDAVFAIQGMVLTSNIDYRQFLGFSGSAGLRYLFSQESVRPYLGLGLAYLQLVPSTASSDGSITASVLQTAWLGLEPFGGIDYFPEDSWSIGLRAEVDVYWWLNQNAYLTLGLHAVMAFYF